MFGEKFTKAMAYFFKKIPASKISKRGSYIVGSLFSLSFIFLFQNCQQAANSFKTKDVNSSSVLLLSLTSTPVNSVNCNDGLKVIISTYGNFLAEAPYSFDGGKTWDIANFKIYTEDATIDIGQAMIKDADGNTVSNTQAYIVEMISCNLVVGQNCLAPAGSYCPAGSSIPQPCSAGYTCAGGTAQPQQCQALPMFYCPVGTTEPVACPANKTCAGGTAQPVDPVSNLPQVAGICNNGVTLGCTKGSAISDNGQSSCGTMRTWYCSGQNGGANSPQCNLQNPSCAQSIAGSCNNATPGGCLAGSLIQDNNQTTCGTTRNWYCSGQNGGANSSQCSYPNASCAQPIAGVCNNSMALGCSAGNVVSDNGATACGTTRTWSCTGQNGGSNSSQCSLANQACAQPINGACSSTAGQCASGSVVGDNYQTACGTTRNWTCSGLNNGSNAPCSLANSSCPVQDVCHTATGARVGTQVWHQLYKVWNAGTPLEATDYMISDQQSESGYVLYANNPFGRLLTASVPGAVPIYRVRWNNFCSNGSPRHMTSLNPSAEADCHGQPISEGAIGGVFINQPTCSGDTPFIHAAKCVCPGPSSNVRNYIIRPVGQCGASCTQGETFYMPNW